MDEENWVVGGHGNASRNDDKYEKTKYEENEGDNENESNNDNEGGD